MEFEYPFLLLLLIPVFLCWIWAWRKAGPSIRVSSVENFKESSSRDRKIRICWRRLLPMLCFLLSAICIVLALAGPRQGSEQMISRAEGIDIIQVVDLSGSMNAIDLPPNRTEKQLLDSLRNGTLKNRLDTACMEIEKFVKERPNDRIGLIVFADLPYVICPPTLDHPFLLANLKRLKAGSIGSQTGIASPLASAVNRLRNSEAKSKIIILFTDGANNVNALVSPKDAARLAEQFDIRIYTVGIGGQRSVVPYMGTYAPAQNSFDEELLKELASLSGGRYYKAADAQGMAQAMADINQLERNVVEQNVLINWKEWYPRITMLAIIFLVLGLLLRETVCLRLP